MRTTGEKAQGPARIGEIKIEIDYPVEPGGVVQFDASRREGLLRAVHNCMIHNTLLHPPKIEVNLRTSPSVVPAST